MNWRPSGTWQKSREAMVKQCSADPQFQNTSLEVIMAGLFEAGADAILEKLRKAVDSIKVKKNERGETPSMVVGGTWVFIPGDEVKS